MTPTRLIAAIAADSKATYEERTLECLKAESSPAHREAAQVFATLHLAAVVDEFAVNYGRMIG